jgi:hypothetical protein
MFLRPEVAEFPEYIPSLRPDYERDFRGTLGRENVAASNFGDILKIGGFAATGLGGLVGKAGNIFGIGQGTFNSIGSGLTGFSSSFYPRR